MCLYVCELMHDMCVCVCVCRAAQFWMNFCAQSFVAILVSEMFPLQPRRACESSSVIVMNYLCLLWPGGGGVFGALVAFYFFSMQYVFRPNTACTAHACFHCV